MTGDALGDAPVCTCIGTLLGPCVAAGGPGDAPGSVNDSWRSRFLYIYFAEIVYFAEVFIYWLCFSPTLTIHLSKAKQSAFLFCTIF